MTGRPSAAVVRSKYDLLNKVEVEILEAAQLWVVVYKEEYFNLRHSSKANTYKYIKTSFANPAFAYRLAKKLNTFFKSTDFTVRVLG